MVNLRNFKNTTASRLDELVGDGTPRPYLGMSQIGHSCDRYLWYSFRWCFKKQIDARLKRLFKRGHREEKEIVCELEQIGIKCYDDQAEVSMAFGYSKGHCDGKAIGVIEAPKTEHLLEFKTMSDKYFKMMIKQGVKVSKPIYYAQCQIYMYKLGLTRALFIVVNKNNDAYYIERVKLDKGFAEDLERKAEKIVLSETPPTKEFLPTWYECKFCDARSICHGNVEIEKTCRTCIHCDLIGEGKWTCKGVEMTTAEQRVICSDYKMIPLS